MRGRFEFVDALPALTSTAATLVCELAASFGPPVPETTLAPVRDSTGVLSSGTLEQAASVATASALRRWRWMVFMLFPLLVELRAGFGAAIARKGPTPA